jgi:hypothetical protein
MMITSSADHSDHAWAALVELIKALNATRNDNSLRHVEAEVKKNSCSCQKSNLVEELRIQILIIAA